MQVSFANLSKEPILDFGQTLIRWSHSTHPSKPSQNDIPDDHIHADSKAPRASKHGLKLGLVRFHTPKG